jgi:hypothetical protein
MKIEKVVLSFVAILVGLVVAGIAFFIYQSTKIIPQNKIPKIVINSPTPLPGTSHLFLSIDTPSDETVVANKSLTISGKTIQNATLIINTSSDTQVVNPASNGNYSVTVTLDDGENQVTIIAIAPNGEEMKKTITVTYSTEEF